jgi:hypothetical protein
MAARRCEIEVLQVHSQYNFVCAVCPSIIYFKHGFKIIGENNIKCACFSFTYWPLRVLSR